jgi:prepilin-type N-terminal cleavage/methylation domain-containing protein
MKKTYKFAGFTLIELLIVIGLLAALAAVLLPSLTGSKEEALAGLDKYNAAGTLRTLRQYEAITGLVPNGLHTGLEATNSTATNLMDVTAAYSANASQLGSVVALTPGDVKALQSIGITKLAYGKGDPDNSDPDLALGYEDVVTGINVVTLTEDWVGEDGPITFNGKGFDALQAEGYSKIINLFISPTADWSARGNGWAKGFSVKMDVPGTCPIVDEEFSYYTVFIGLKSEGYVDLTATSGGTYAPSVTVPATASDLATAKAAIEALVGSGLALDTDYGGAWATGWNDVVGTSTRVFNTRDGTDNGTVSFTITTHTGGDGTATLLGTSCPEHGVTNP